MGITSKRIARKNYLLKGYTEFSFPEKFKHCYLGITKYEKIGIIGTQHPLEGREMILNALIRIGESLKPDNVSFDLDPEIIEYINIKYPNPPKKRQIIKIIIKPEIVDFLDHLEKKVERTRFHNIEYGKIPKKEKKKVEDTIIKHLDIEKDVLKDFLKTELQEYEEYYDYMILRGNKSGANVFHSPTLYEKVSSSTGVDKLPLWKINRDLESCVDCFDEEEIYISKFFKYLPSMREFSRIVENDPRSIVKFIISRLFVEATSHFVKEKYNLKSGNYYMPLCFDGKWPYEFKVFRSCYKASIVSSDTGKKGVCEGCAKRKSLTDGLTGELGFFTIDQKGFSYSFFSNKSYQLCDECKINAEKGLNYIKKHQRVYLGDRGTKKNPFLMYVIPIADEGEDMEKVLEEVDLLIKPTSKGREMDNVKVIGNIAEKAKLKEKQAKKQKQEEIKDVFDMLGDQIKKENTSYQVIFSLLLVTFYHPEGQASSFHNVVSIDFLDYSNIIRFAKGIAKLEHEMGEKVSLKDIYYVFGQHKFRKYVSSLFRFQNIDMRQLCKESYLNLKIDFYKLMAKPESYNGYARLNLKRLNSYIGLARSLQLL